MNNHVDIEKSSRLSIFEQMGNIGSEVGRAISAHRRGDTQSEDAAIARAIDLFDATAGSLAQQKSPRTREVLRSKEQFLGLFFDNNFTDAGAVERYFMQFALAARMGR
jgi:hypothetical protein